MDYRLVILTHGKHPTLRPTVLSFAENVTPAPAEVLVVYDGPSLQVSVPMVGWEHLRFQATGASLGFCKATSYAWEAAAAPGPDWVFWLEHDFTFNRPVDLGSLAHVMNHRPLLQQMALYRQPVNEVEVEMGGYVNRWRDEFVDFTMDEDMPEELQLHWMEQRSFWTTNPSLFRRHTAVEHPWAEPPHCEGMFGRQLKSAITGAAFGLWGDGEPWVEHIGTRDGHGY